MKKLAIRTLGWGIGWSLGGLAFIQLPVLAANNPANTPWVNAASSSHSLFGSVSFSEQTPTGQIQQPQLLAVALGARNLQQGDSGADVRILQRYLSRNGLYPYEVDGVFGIETATAVATYQRIRNLPATGIADEETLVDMEFDFLPTAAAPAFTPSAAPSAQGTSLLSGNLVPGSSGSDVIALQQRLNAFGIPLFVDGVYGFETEQAVRTYQRVQGLNATGSADNATLESMGFAVPNYPYIAAVIADGSRLSEVQRFFPEAFVDRNRRGRFINIGTFAGRSPAEARVDAAAARGFTTRVLYRRSGLFR